MYSSFEAWLRALDVKLQLHMLQPVLQVLHMTKVETHTHTWCLQFNSDTCIISCIIIFVTFFSYWQIELRKKASDNWKCHKLTEMCNLCISACANNQWTAYLDRAEKFPPDLLPPSSTGGLPITLDWLSKCTNHLHLSIDKWVLVHFTFHKKGL